MMPAFCNPPKILAVFLAVAAAAEAQQAPVVSVAEEPAQKMMYGMDFERLWSGTH